MRVFPRQDLAHNLKGLVCDCVFILLSLLDDAALSRCYFVIDSVNTKACLYISWTTVKKVS